MRVSREHGLEIVVPERGRMPDIARILAEHAAWILRRLGKREDFLRERSELQGESPFASVQPGFQLHGGGLRVNLEVLPGRGKGGAYWSDIFQNMTFFVNKSGAMPDALNPPLPNEINWPVAAGSPNQMHERLSLCLRSYARYYLQKRLAWLAAFYRLSYSGFGLGKQKSRWGSFAADGMLRLNCKLVFISRELSDHVILHELCHSVHHNHSSNFWLLMQEKDELALKKNAKLLKAGIWVPSWFN